MISVMYKRCLFLLLLNLLIATTTTQTTTPIPACPACTINTLDSITAFAGIVAAVAIGSGLLGFAIGWYARQAKYNEALGRLQPVEQTGLLPPPVVVANTRMYKKIISMDIQRC